MLKQEGIDVEGWPKEAQRSEAWGDPAGDNKLEFRSPEGRAVVLKLKTAPDVANGILDQYELGPYNLIIMGQPSRWHGEVMAFFRSGIVQTVTTMAPCSVLVARDNPWQAGLLHLHQRVSRRAPLQAVRRLRRPGRGDGRADHPVLGRPHTAAGKPAAEEAVANARGAAQGHEDPGRGNARRRRQSGRGDR